MKAATVARGWLGWPSPLAGNEDTTWAPAAPQGLPPSFPPMFPQLVHPRGLGGKEDLWGRGQAISQLKPWTCSGGPCTARWGEEQVQNKWGGLGLVQTKTEG